MTTHPWLRAAAGVWLATGMVPCSDQAQSANDATLRGVWETETYLLEDGTRHEVDGHIFFAERDWTVLFFIGDDGGNPRRGSGEGGTYSLRGNELVFTHLYHLSAGEEVQSLPASPLRMEVHAAADAPREECRIAIDGDRLTIHFPSGNSMTFRRG